MVLYLSDCTLLFVIALYTRFCSTLDLKRKMFCLLHRIIKLHPDGSGTVGGRYVSVYLECVDIPPKEKAKAEYCLRIKNQLNDEHGISETGEIFKLNSHSDAEPFYM